jgi:hypothetical protein
MVRNAYREKNHKVDRKTIQRVLDTLESKGLIKVITFPLEVEKAAKLTTTRLDMDQSLVDVEFVLLADHEKLQTEDERRAFIEDSISLLKPNTVKKRDISQDDYMLISQDPINPQSEAEPLFTDSYTGDFSNSIIMDTPKEAEQPKKKRARKSTSTALPTPITLPKSDIPATQGTAAKPSALTKSKGKKPVVASSYLDEDDDSLIIDIESADKSLLSLLDTKPAADQLQSSAAETLANKFSLSIQKRDKTITDIWMEQEDLQLLTIYLEKFIYRTTKGLPDYLKKSQKRRVCGKTSFSFNPSQSVFDIQLMVINHLIVLFPSIIDSLTVIFTFAFHRMSTSEI